MNVIYRFEQKPTFVIADPHGHWDVLRQRIEKCDEMHDCILFIAGDNKLGFDKHERVLNNCELLNKVLANKNIVCFMLRGNHDNPSYYDGNTISLSHLHAIPDYTIVQVGEENILCVGGAISIDRMTRKQEYMRKINCLKEIYTFEDDFEIAKNKVIPTHWSSENPVFDPQSLEEIHNNSIKISHVITHTSPNFAFKNDIDGLEPWFKEDPSLKDDNHNERMVFTNIYAWLLSHEHPLTTWTYGHFHEHEEMDIADCKFTALHRCDEIFDYFQLNLQQKFGRLKKDYYICTEN